MDDEAITDDVLHSIWQGVEVMRTHRIAHRDLRLANVMLAPDGRPWIIDFGFAEIAATDQMLDTDVAELLSSTALKVGVTRAVDAAIAVIGKPAVAQRGAAHPAARAQHGDAQVADRRASRCATSCASTPPRPAAPATSSLRTCSASSRARSSSFVSLAVAFYLLIPQLADVSGVWSKLKDADWTWALYALGASVAHLRRRDHRADWARCPGASRSSARSPPSWPARS